MERDTPLSERLRVAVRRSRLSLDQIADEAGIDAAALRRFAGGESSLDVDEAGRVLDLLGFRSCPRRG